MPTQTTVLDIISHLCNAGYYFHVWHWLKVGNNAKVDTLYRIKYMIAREVALLWSYHQNHVVWKIRHFKKTHEITICSKHVMDANRDTKTEFTIIITT